VHLSQPAFQAGASRASSVSSALRFSIEPSGALTSPHMAQTFCRPSQNDSRGGRELRRDVEMMKNYESAKCIWHWPITRRRDPGPILKEMIENYSRSYVFTSKVAHWPYLLELPASGEARIRDCRYPRDSGFTDFRSDAVTAIAASCYCRAGHPLLSKKDLAIRTGELSTGFGDPPQSVLSNSPRAEFD